MLARSSAIGLLWRSLRNYSTKPASTSTTQLPQWIDDANDEIQSFFVVNMLPPKLLSPPPPIQLPNSTLMGTNSPMDANFPSAVTMQMVNEANEEFEAMFVVNKFGTGNSHSHSFSTQQVQTQSKPPQYLQPISATELLSEIDEFTKEMSKYS